MFCGRRDTFSGSGGGRPFAWTEIHHYDHLIEKPKDTVPDVPGFTLVKSVPIRFTFTVEGEQVENLLSMTPHVFRIGKDGAQRLRETRSLTDTASCVLNVFRPVGNL